MRILLATALIIAMLASFATAQTRVSRVIPSLEIEILDPNVDASGNPGVIVGQDAWGQTQVDIAPTIMVHRYYYTGDRTFRGPDLPGGPSIIVAFHPRNGQKVYLPVQMLPGSPMVTYSAQSIEYDYGDRAVIVSFPRIGQPTVVYRNGRSFTDRLGNLLHWNDIKSVIHPPRASERTTNPLDLSAEAKSVAQPLMLPLQNMARYIPGVTPLKYSKWGEHVQGRQDSSNSSPILEP
jgi:hypothetical protein